MRHRPSEPLVNLWRRLPRALAGSVSALAELNALPALTVLVMTLGIGTSAFVAVASVGRPSHEAAQPAVLRERPAPTASRDGDRPDLPGAGSHRVHEGLPTPGVPFASRSRSPRQPDRVTAKPSRTAAASPTRQGAPAAPRSGWSTSPSPQPSESAASPASSDDTPPDTAVASRFPDGDAARFSFTATETATYTCSLDGTAYTPCSSPSSFWGLHPGWHTFAVRATDAAGNVDPSPAEVTWHANAGDSTADKEGRT